MKKIMILLCFILAATFILASCSLIDNIDPNKKNECTEHQFKETVVPPTCTAEGYTEKVCSVCQKTERTDPTEKTAHTGDPCTVCGYTAGTASTFPALNLPDNYAYDLLTKNVSFNGAIVINDVQVVTESVREHNDGTVETETSTVKFNFAELAILPDSESASSYPIIGYGRLEAVQTDVETSDGETVETVFEVDAQAYIKDGIIYIMAETSEDSVIARYPIDAMLASEEELAGTLAMLEAFAPTLESIAANLGTFANALLLNGKGDINTAAATMIALLCDVEKEGDIYTISLSADKLLDLNDKLSTMTVKDLINYVSADEKAWDNLSKGILDILDVNLAQILAAAKANGLNAEDLIDQIFVIIDGMGLGETLGMTAEDIKGMLEDADFMATTVGDMIVMAAGDETLTVPAIKETISKALASVCDIKPYDALAGQFEGTTPVALKEQVDAVLAMIGTSASIEVKADANAIIKNVAIKVVNLQGVNADIEIIADYATEYDYAAVAAAVDLAVNSVQYTDEEFVELLNSSSDFYNDIVYVLEDGVITGTYQSELYFDRWTLDDATLEAIENLADDETLTIENATLTYSICNIYLALDGAPITISTVCGDWISYDLMGSETYTYMTVIATIEVNRNGEIVKCSEPTSENVDSSYSYSADIGFYVNELTGEKTTNSSKVHVAVLVEEESNEFNKHYECECGRNSYDEYDSVIGGLLP